MKTRISAVILVATVSVLFTSPLATQAQAPAQAVLGSVVNDVFNAVNAEDTQSALSLFADKATLDDRISGKAYISSEEIAAMLQGWERDGRQYRVTQESTINLARGLDAVFSQIEVSDSGFAWGEETTVALVYNGKIQRLDVTGVHLIPIQHWHR